MNVLFIHNVVSEYRVVFMKELYKRVQVDFLITNQLMEKKIYNLHSDMGIENLKVCYVQEGLKRFREIKSKITEKKYDVVVLPSADTAGQFANGLFSLLVCKKRKIKTIYWSEKWEADWNCQPFLKKVKNLIHRCMIGLLARNSALCIAAGSQTQNYFKSIGVSPEKIRVVFDSSISKQAQSSIDIRQLYGIPKNGKIILYLGRIVKRKGCDILLKAMSSLNKKYDNLYLLICGDGEFLNPCKQLCQELHIQNTIFAGKVSPFVRSQYYEQADVFVLPSYTYKGVIECWGLTVNEALEFGTPVIATTAVGSSYDLLNGDNGLQIKEQDMESLEKAIETIVYKKEKEALHDVAVAVAKRFSPVNMADGFKKVFCEIITKGS